MSQQQSPQGGSYGAPPHSASLPANLHGASNVPSTHSTHSTVTTGFPRNPQSFPATLPTGHSELILSLDKDHLEIKQSIREIDNEDLIELGQALGLALHKLKRMRMPGGMVAAWLRQEDNVIKTTGNPTWSTLANTLDYIGQCGYAKKIREAHNIPQPESIQNNSAPTDCQEDEQCVQLNTSLAENGLNLGKEDIQVLIGAGFVSVDNLLYLNTEDLPELLKKLSLGGKGTVENFWKSKQTRVHDHDPVNATQKEEKGEEKEMAAQAQNTTKSERQQQPSTMQATTGNPRSEQQVIQQPNISRNTTELPGSRVTHDHSEPGKSERVMTGGGGYTGKNNGENVVTQEFKAPLPVPDGWNPPETDSDGPCKQTSYPPYPRVIKDDRKMKHTPKLKLDKDPKSLTKLDTDEIQLPASLVGNYDMKRACKSREKGHGLALIINNEKFARHRQRVGTYRDEYNLVETFRFLGYRVEIRRDCSKEVIEGLFGDIDPMIEEEDDSFVCCILSHGSNNVVYGSDSNRVILRTEENSLEVKLSKCTKLEGKPKLFFVSTCRGVTAQMLEKDGDDSTHEPEADSNQNPRADFAFNYATLSGEASWRHPNTGTFYIQKLCRFLCENATKATLSDIQKRVAQEVSEMENHQMPNIEEQTTKNVYFFDDFFENPTVHISTSNPLDDKQ